MGLLAVSAGGKGGGGKKVQDVNADQGSRQNTMGAYFYRQGARNSITGLRSDCLCKIIRTP